MAKKTQTQQVSRIARGLHLTANQSHLPEGALSRAENILIDRDGVVAKARGFDRYGLVQSLPGGRFGEFNDTLLKTDGTSILYDSDGAGTWVAFAGSFTKPDGTVKIRFREAIPFALYWTTDTGVKRLSRLFPTIGAIRDAGMPKGLDMDPTEVPAGVVLPGGNQLSYRNSWARIDENGQEVAGQDSEPLIVSKASGPTVDITLDVTLPDDIIAGDFIDLWRTLHIANPGPTGDTYFKVFRREIDAGQVAAGVITFTDGTDEAFLDFGTQLVTNPEVEGPDQEDSKVPLARDMALFKGHFWIVHGRREHFLEIRFLDIAGITDGVDTLSFTDGSTTLVYTFETAENIGLLEFERFTAGTLAENVRDTMQSLVRVINRDSTNSLFYAFYTSGAEDAPGKVRIRRRDYTDTAIDLTQPSGGAGGNFEPVLPTAGSTVSTIAEADFPNRISFSKFEQPDSVPRTNFFDVDSARNEVVRILNIRDSLIVLTERSVWRISGDTEQDFQLRLLDPSTRIRAAESAVVLNNAVYAFTSQGVVRITENGVAIVSRPIEFELNKVLEIPGFADQIFAISYEEERQYWLATPSVSTDTFPTVIWINNFITDSWVQRVRSVTDGWVLKEGDRLYLAHAIDDFVIKERKSFDPTNQLDFSDEEIDITIDAIGTAAGIDDPDATVTTLDVTYTYTTIEMGEGFFVIQAATSAQARVFAVEELTATTFRLTLDRLEPAFTVAAATVEIHIQSEVAWSDEGMGDVSISKQFSRAQIYFNEDRGVRHRIGFSTDMLGGEEFVAASIFTDGFGWGIGSFGFPPWGDDGVRPSTIVRTAVPRDFQRCRALTVRYRHQEARASFIINQVALQARVVSERTVRTPR